MAALPDRGRPAGVGLSRADGDDAMQVRLHGSDVQFRCEPGQTLLAAGLAAGLDPCPTNAPAAVAAVAGRGCWKARCGGAGRPRRA